MKRTFLTIGLAITSILLLSSFQPAPSPKSHQLTLKIISSDPTQEVSFEAAYIIKRDNSQLQALKQSTPLSISENAEFASAIFHKLNGKADLKVTIFSTTDSIMREQASASGDIIIVGTRSGENGVVCYAGSY